LFTTLFSKNKTNGERLQRETDRNKDGNKRDGQNEKTILCLLHDNGATQAT
jgi:hypothetical protein